jgi:hypothetical protein
MIRTNLGSFRGTEFPLMQTRRTLSPLTTNSVRRSSFGDRERRDKPAHCRGWESPTEKENDSILASSLACGDSGQTKLPHIIKSVRSFGGYTVVIPYAPVLSPLPTRIQTRVTFGQVLLCRKKHLATYIKPGNALSLRIEDIGRRRLLTQPRLSRHLPVVSAFRVSEG